MTPKQEAALRLALEALESCNAGDYSTGHVIHPSFDVDAVNRAIDALDTALEQPAQQEIDWKDQYEKQKRRAEMWVSKYEADIGPVEKAGPVTAQQEPVAIVKVLPMGHGQADMHWAELQHVPEGTPLYTRPQAREPLTDEQIMSVIASIDPDEQYMPKALRQFARAIEAAHGITGDSK